MNGGPILLVEGSTDDALLTRRAFEIAQIENEIITVEDGESALDLLLPEDAPGLDPVVVLLDLNLPIIDGHEVLRRIRADPRTRFLPVVVLTTSDEESDLRKAYGNGVNSYVRKPVDYNEFLEAIKVMGMYWSLLNRRAAPRA